VKPGSFVDPWIPGRIAVGDKRGPCTSARGDRYVQHFGSEITVNKRCMKGDVSLARERCRVLGSERFSPVGTTLVYPGGGTTKICLNENGAK